MSNDSIAQYSQALTGQYSSWHPPLMSITLSGIMALGGDIGELMLIQCFLGVLGVKSLAKSFYEYNLKEKAEAGFFKRWSGISVLLLLLIPVSPLIFYLMTFWKDVWLFIILIWIIVYLIWVFKQSGCLSGFWLFAHISVISFLMAMAGNIRHNAKIILPAFCVCLAIILKHAGKKNLIYLSALPLLLVFLLDWSVNRIFNVQKAHIENLIMATDLVGACVVKPDICKDFEYIDKNLRPELIPQYFKFGDVEHFIWTEPLILGPDVVDPGKENLELRREYFRAVAGHPFILAAAKFRAFANMITPRARTAYWIQFDTVPNRIGIGFGGRMEPVRKFFIRIASIVSSNRFLHWLSGEHLVWLILGIISFAGALRNYRNYRNAETAFLAAILLCTLLYSFSYLIVTQGWDFRYMYPSMLIIQIYSGAKLIFWAGRLRRKA